MSEGYELRPLPDTDSARIAIGERFLVVDGPHLQISRGFFHKRADSVTIKRSDVLFVERKKMRQNRWLFIGLVLFGLYLLMVAAADAPKEYFKAGFEGVAESEIEEVIATEMADPMFDQAVEEMVAKDPAFRTISTIYSVLENAFLIFSFPFVGAYILWPISALRIKAMGSDFAVDTKNYDTNKVDGFIQAYHSSGHSG